MARLLRSESISEHSDGLLSRYAGWLDWNFKNVILGALWFLFMGIWIAVPTLHAIQHGATLATPVVIPGSNHSTFTAPLLWIGISMTVCFLLGVTLLVSCFALWRGWLKQPTPH